MIELKAGVFLLTQEEIIDDQKGWDEFDDSKEIDFTIYPYWITTDNGEEPVGIDNLEELRGNY